MAGASSAHSWAPKDYARFSSSPPVGVAAVRGGPGRWRGVIGERVLVAFHDGAHYAGHVVAVEPGRHRVRASNGVEGWITDADVILGPFG